VRHRAPAAAAAADAATADAALFDATRDALDAAAAAAAAAQGGACDPQMCPVGAFLSRDPQCHLTDIVGRVSVIDLWNTRSKLLPRKIAIEQDAPYDCSVSGTAGCLSAAGVLPWCSCLRHS